MSDVLNSLVERVSVPANLLREPIPTDTELEQIIQAALSAPDHGGLRPWRFLSIAGTARNKLGDIFCEAALIENPELSETEQAAIKQKPLRSPLIITVIAVTKSHPKVPVHEQTHSAAAAAQNILLASNALGFDAIWLTGPFASHRHVCKKLELAEHEQVIAFIYLGTADEAGRVLSQKKQQNRPKAADYLQKWGI